MEFREGAFDFQTSQQNLQTLKEDPYLPTQSFEKLKPTHEGRYSRRLNRQHRVVYKVDEDEHVVEIYSARTHYESQ
ncbi:TPA: Txe/YoeB family addiction module toxin [Enterococcus faecium]